MSLFRDLIDCAFGVPVDQPSYQVHDVHPVHADPEWHNNFGTGCEYTTQESPFGSFDGTEMCGGFDYSQGCNDTHMFDA